MLTKRQKEVFDFIAVYQKEKGYAPSLEEISRELSLSSVSTAHFHISNLKKAGYLNKQIGKARGIETRKSTSMIKIPLLGIIAAGQPIEAIETKETIAVPADSIPHTGNLFALTVQGESMIGENIHDGDVILVKQQTSAENGDTVVALIDGEGATVKKFYRERRQIRLQPSNDSFEPIIIRNNHDLKIQGVVIDVIKNLPKQPSPQFPVRKNKAPKRSLPLNKIILGDAVQELQKLPKESCDVIIIDPPYNIGKDFGNNIDRRELGEYIEWSKAWINESIRTLKPSGTMFIYGFSEILAYLSVEIPIHKRWLIWHYTNKNVASVNFWQRSHEAIICAWKDKPIFNRDAVREPYTDGFLNGAAGKIRANTAGRFSSGGGPTIYHAHAGGALPRDVLKIPALAGGAGMTERWFFCKTCDETYSPRELNNHKRHEIIKHPTQKPFELSKRLIRAAVPSSSGVILVPFVGSGSECAAAKVLGHNYIGFELNPDYVALAKGVIRKFKKVPA